jgi:hypothetical protein
MEITRLESEVNILKARLRESKVANLLQRPQPSRGGSRQTPVTSVKHQQPSFGGGKKLYSEALITGPISDTSSL